MSRILTASSALMLLGCSFAYGQGGPPQLGGLTPGEGGLFTPAYNSLEVSVDYSNNECYSNGSIGPAEATVSLVLELRDPDPLFASSVDYFEDQVLLGEATINQAEGTVGPVYYPDFPILYRQATLRAILQQHGGGNCNQTAELTRVLDLEDLPLSELFPLDAAGVSWICELIHCIFDPYEDPVCEQLIEDGLFLAVVLARNDLRLDWVSEQRQTVRLAELYWKKDSMDPADPNDDVLQVRNGHIGDLLEFETDFELPLPLSIGSSLRQVTVDGSVRYQGFDVPLNGQYSILQLIAYEEFRMSSGVAVPTLRLELLPQDQPNSPLNPLIAGTLWFDENGILVGIRFRTQGSTPFYVDASDGFLGTARLAINTNTISAGQPFRITIEEQAGSGAAQSEVVDFYVVVLLPDGTFFSFLQGGGISGPNQLQPLISGQAPTDQSYSLLDIPWPAGLPAGRYSFVGAQVLQGDNVLDPNNWRRVYIGGVEAQ